MISRICFVVLSCSVLAACPGLNKKTTPTATIACTVTKVSDGDTIGCTTADKQFYTVRLANIDAPEKKQDFGNAAKKYLGNLIFQKPVEIRLYSQDKYGRHIGEVYLADLNVNKYMVQHGYAWAYKEYLTDQEYVVLQDNAQTNKFGLWIAPNPMAPNLFRRSSTN